jgi:hypothetical protein
VTRGAGVGVLVVLLLTPACDSRGPTTPTSAGDSPALTPPAPTPSSGIVPIPPRPAMAFGLTGIVTDERGAPVSGARVSIWLDYSDNPFTLTGHAGGYQLDFTGQPGGNHFPADDPAGTRDSVAFSIVEAAGYEPHVRHLLGTTQRLVENVQLQRIQRITAGQSVVVALSKDDSVCVVDAWPGRALICRTVRVDALRNGIMTIEAVPVQAGSERAMVHVYGRDTGGRRGNSTAIQIIAGSEYVITVDLPWGFDGNPSFLVKTSVK